MKNSDVIYNGIIKDINFKLCRNYTPYIEILVETLDVNKALISSCYYFTGKSKYLSYNELSNLLEYFDIKVEDEILSSLNSLIGKEVYLIKNPDFESKYKILKDYKEEVI